MAEKNDRLQSQLKSLKEDLANTRDDQVNFLIRLTRVGDKKKKKKKFPLCFYPDLGGMNFAFLVSFHFLDLWFLCPYQQFIKCKLINIACEIYHWIWIWTLATWIRIQRKQKIFQYQKQKTFWILVKKSIELLILQYSVLMLEYQYDIHFSIYVTFKFNPDPECCQNLLNYQNFVNESTFRLKSKCFFS